MNAPLSPAARASLDAEFARLSAWANSPDSSSPIDELAVAIVQIIAEIRADYERDGPCAAHFHSLRKLINLALEFRTDFGLSPEPPATLPLRSDLA